MEQDEAPVWDQEEGSDNDVLQWESGDPGAGWKVGNLDHTITTYHTVMIPPTEPFKSKEDAIKWAQNLLGILLLPNDRLGGATPIAVPKDCYPENHVVLVLGTEFGFNKYATRAEGFNFEADASRPVRFDLFLIALDWVHAQLQDMRAQPQTIVLAISAVVDYGFDPASSKHWAEKAAFIINNRVKGFQKLSKYKVADEDKWNLNKFKDWNADRPDKQDSDQRMSEHTHVIRGFRKDAQGRLLDLSIGFGICADSVNERYPDIQLLCFLSGQMRVTWVREDGLGGFLVSDTAHFGYTKSSTIGPGERTFNSTNSNSNNDNAQKPQAGEHRLWGPKLSEFERGLEESKRRGKLDPQEEKYNEWLSAPPSLYDICILNNSTTIEDKKGVKGKAGDAWPLTVNQGKVPKTVGRYIAYAPQRYTALEGGVVWGLPRRLPKEPVSASTSTGGGGGPDPGSGTAPTRRLAPMYNIDVIQSDLIGLWDQDVEAKWATAAAKWREPANALWAQAWAGASREGRQLQGFEWAGYVSRALRGVWSTNLHGDEW